MVTALPSLEKRSRVGLENSVRMQFLYVLPKTAHGFSWSNGRRVELLFADRALGDAHVSIGNWFQADFPFHASYYARKTGWR
jgi:hypothetical protein